MALEVKKTYLSDPMLTVKKTGLLPVLDPCEGIVSIAEALLRAGVRVMELTADEDTASCIRTLAQQQPDLSVGVQWVDNEEDAADFIRAGAAWIVTPGVCPNVVKTCAKMGTDCIPAVASEGEITKARAIGLHVVRCSAEGRSPRDVAALHDALRDINYILTGVPREEVHRYMNLPCVLAVSERYISRSMILLQDWDGIETSMTERMLHMLDFHIGHVGFNTFTPENGKVIADRMESLFGFMQHPSEVNIFADEKFELLTIPNGPGTHGHIQMLCSSVERGRAFLSRLGLELEETAKYLPTGVRSAVIEETKVFVIPRESWDVEFASLNPEKYAFLHYLTEQIGDFAFHLGRELNY